jgi:hypothetical protein
MTLLYVRAAEGWCASRLPLYVCPHSAYVCPHAAIYVSSYCCICVYMRPQRGGVPPGCLYMCVLMLLMCPHTAVYVCICVLMADSRGY